jgi:hypothetical protein
MSGVMLLLLVVATPSSEANPSLAPKLGYHIMCMTFPSDLSQRLNVLLLPAITATACCSSGHNCDNIHSLVVPLPPTQKACIVHILNYPAFWHLYTEAIICALKRRVPFSKVAGWLVSSC